MKPAQLFRGGAIQAVFRDNAMFYKDITQWLRNRTFASLFFGLLILAEGLSLFVIFISSDMNEPGSTLFYTLYLVLLVYAMLIAYQGNSLTTREFSNQTFELFELSGMSLERMVGGKLLSMLYQFFFGFFCLVPFMFFAYIVGGLDFFEMIVGVVLAAFLALPLYLLALATALTARLKQVTLLVKLASLLFVVGFVFSMVMSTFANESVLRSMVRAITELVGRAAKGESVQIMALIAIVVMYVQACLLFFYLCCDNVSGENDSREIAVKVLMFTLIISWILLIFLPDAVTGGKYGGINRSDEYIVVVPAFLAIMSMGLRGFYSSTHMPLIVKRRYADAKGPRQWFFWIFQPGIRGGFRSVMFVTGVSLLLFVTLTGDWTSRAAMLAQAPWFLAFPFFLFAGLGDIRSNPANQRTLVVTCWVILGTMVILGSAWTRSNLYSSGPSGWAVALAILISPLSSLSLVGSADAVVEEMGKVARLMSGVLGVVLMYMHVREVIRRDEEKHLLDEGRSSVATPGTDGAAAAIEPAAVDPQVD